jgi:hypothetical protein
MEGGGPCTGGCGGCISTGGGGAIALAGGGGVLADAGADADGADAEPGATRGLALVAGTVPAGAGPGAWAKAETAAPTNSGRQVRDKSKGRKEVRSGGCMFAGCPFRAGVRAAGTSPLGRRTIAVRRIETRARATVTAVWRRDYGIDLTAIRAAMVGRWFCELRRQEGGTPQKCHCAPPCQTKDRRKRLTLAPRVSCYGGVLSRNLASVRRHSSADVAKVLVPGARGPRKNQRFYGERK